MKRVLVVVPSFRITDGISTIIMGYYDNLIANGWHLDFMTPNTTDGKWVDKAVHYGSRVYVLPQKSKFSKEVRSEIQMIIRSGDYDILHTNFPGQVTNIAIKEAKRKGCKIIYHCHNPKNTSSFKAWVSNSIFDNYAISSADCLVACSSYVGKSRYRNKDYHVLKNTIDPEEFDFSLSYRNTIREQYKLTDKFVIGVVGRMTLQKNPDFILECFKNVHLKNPRAHLVWIGTGELERHILELSKEKQIDSYCSFVGKQSNVNEWYSAMDVFFLPSLFEGFGIAFLEAQCSGLPCLASDAVPDDVMVTNLMNKMSLFEDTEKWAKQILLLERRVTNRKGNIDAIEKAGYSKRDSNSELKELYENL